jgi:hypothetical protein
MPQEPSEADSDLRASLPVDRDSRPTAPVFADASHESCQNVAATLGHEDRNQPSHFFFVFVAKVVRAPSAVLKES